jgi:hypothetical protein
MFILFQRNELSVLERDMKNSVHGTSTLDSNETQVSKYEGSVGKTEKRQPPPYLTSHEVYEMIKDVHIDLGR